MSMSNASETNLLLLLFNNTDWANVGDAAGLQNSAAAGNFYVARASRTWRRSRIRSSTPAAIPSTRKPRCCSAARCNLPPEHYSGRSRNCGAWRKCPCPPKPAKARPRAA